MRARLSGAFLAAVLAMALLPFKAGGCGKTACITFSADEYAAAGRCPSAEEVMRFWHQNCGMEIRAVDGEGTHDAELCCYPVTENAGDDAPGCVGGFGGGFGGFGGFGGSSSCIRCADQVAHASLDVSGLCFFSIDLWTDLESCACASCGAPCELNLCQGTTPTSECLDCAALSCSPELDACLIDG